MKITKLSRRIALNEIYGIYFGLLMSAGHRHNYVHHPNVIGEVTKLLGTAQVQAYLRRPFRVDTQTRVPFTGGSSVDGSVYYIDPGVPPELRPFVLWHERTEKAFRALFQMPYARAHVLATCAERMLVEARGGDWDQYKGRIARVVRLDEHQQPHAMPAGFDDGPYHETGMMHLLAPSSRSPV